MQLLIIYALVLALSVFCLFYQKGKFNSYQLYFIRLHVISLLLFVIDVLVKVSWGISLRSGWTDRTILLVVLVSATSIFTLYYKHLILSARIYFAIYFFYPCIAVIGYLADGIFGVLLSVPLIFGLMIPQVSYKNEQYELREWGGGLAPVRMRLIEKNTFIEKEIGKCYQEFSPQDSYDNLQVLSSNADSTIVSVKVNGKLERMAFEL